MVNINNKQKSLMLFLVMFITLFINVIFVKAATTGTVRTNDGYGIILRQSASSSSSKVADVPERATVTILNTNAGSGNGCSNNWYQITYAGKTGYACSTYIVADSSTPPTVTDTNYANTLKSKGFPDSYIPYLTEIHKKYPNWQFEALNVSTTFDKMVNEQYTLGKNLINNPADGWKRVDTYLYDQNRFRTDFSGGGAGWYAPSMEVIKYYLDPRNFLNEYDIFTYERLSFNSTYHTRNGVVSLLSGTFMKGNTIDGQNKNYADIFMSAASESQASPYFLSARVIQEVSASRTAAVSGKEPGYVGYYNFYNINATGSSSSYQNVLNGLAKAKSEGWNTEEKAIKGGAKIIATNYINVGQDTLYSQKFDMTNFWHQYQQNIEAPYTEGSKMRKIYVNNNFLSQSFVFKIPVYSGNMGTNPKPNTGNPINALKSLQVNGNSVTGFNRDTKNYTVYVSGASTTASISATPYVSSAKVSGTGNVSLTGTTTTKNVVVTAGNGTTNTYTVNIVKSASIKDLTVDEIMPKIGVKYNNSYISGINPGTSVTSLINNVKKQSAGANVTIKNTNGSVVTSDTFGTGYTVNISSAGTSKTYTIVIYGDINGDGNITILDLLKVQKLILGSTNLSGAYKTATDVNKDGKTTILDLLKVQKHILGSSKIAQ